MKYMISDLDVYIYSRPPFCSGAISCLRRFLMYIDSIEFGMVGLFLACIVLNCGIITTDCSGTNGRTY